MIRAPPRVAAGRALDRPDPSVRALTHGCTGPRCQFRPSPARASRRAACARALARKPQLPPPRPGKGGVEGGGGGAIMLYPLIVKHNE